MIPNALPPNPPVVDLCRPGRALGWILGAGAALLLVVVLAALDGPAFLTVVAGLAGLYAVGASRALVLRRRGLAVLDRPLPPWGLNIKVGLISGTMQPIWSRPSAVLTVRDGMVYLWPMGLGIPVGSVRISTGNRFGRGGIYLDTADGQRFRFTFVNSFDPASNWAWLADSVLVTSLERLLRDETARAVANLPAAGWYPDPTLPHQSRWWDGRGWTHHVQSPSTNPD